MTETPKVEWNELVLVARHQGQCSVWTGWRRALAGFADPRLWESTEAWPEYFERLPDGTAWGPDGYGVVLVDLDTKQAWSMNDYSHPGAIFWPSDHDLNQDDETGAFKARRHLLDRPDQWDKVKLKRHRLSVTDVVRKQPRVEECTLSDLVSIDQSLDERVATLVLARGELRLPKGTFLVMSTEYLPTGWTALDVRGRGDLEVLEPLLAHARAHGFPPPSADLIMGWVENKLEDEEEEEQDAQALLERFQALLNSWPTPAKSLPRP